jgi:hypothetical protein
LYGERKTTVGTTPERWACHSDFGPIPRSVRSGLNTTLYAPVAAETVVPVAPDAGVRQAHGPCAHTGPALTANAATATSELARRGAIAVNATQQTRAVRRLPHPPEPAVVQGSHCLRLVSLRPPWSAHLLELVVDAGGARVPSLILVLASLAGRGDEIVDGGDLAVSGVAAQSFRVAHRHAVATAILGELATVDH